MGRDDSCKLDCMRVKIIDVKFGVVDMGGFLLEVGVCEERLIV